MLGFRGKNDTPRKAIYTHSEGLCIAPTRSRKHLYAMGVASLKKVVIAVHQGNCRGLCSES